jgi:hypothetical protein
MDRAGRANPPGEPGSVWSAAASLSAAASAKEERRFGVATCRGPESAVMPAQSKGNSRNSQLRTCHAGGRGFTDWTDEGPVGRTLRGSRDRFGVRRQACPPQPRRRRNAALGSRHVAARKARSCPRSPKGTAGTASYGPATRAGVVTRKGKVGRTLRVSRDRTAGSPQRATEVHRETAQNQPKIICRRERRGAQRSSPRRLTTNLPRGRAWLHERGG